MKIILLEDISKLGKRDDIVSVKSGYGTYLINNKKAILETKGSARVLKNEIETRALEENLQIKDCEKIKEKLEKEKIVFKVKVGSNDMVFGKISSKQIVIRLKEKGYDIDKKMIKIKDSINSLGTTIVKVHLHKKVIADLKIVLCK